MSFKEEVIIWAVDEQVRGHLTTGLSNMEVIGDLDKSSFGVIVGAKPDWIRVQSSLSLDTALFSVPCHSTPAAMVSGLEWVQERMGVAKVEREDKGNLLRCFAIK